MLLGFPLRHLPPYPAVVVLCLQSTAEEEPLLSQLSLPRASPLHVVQLVVPRCLAAGVGGPGLAGSTSVISYRISYKSQPRGGFSGQCNSQALCLTCSNSYLRNASEPMSVLPVFLHP